MEQFRNVYVIDGGQISITVYQPALDEQNFDDVKFEKPIEESYSALSYEEFLQYEFQPNSLVIGENAHFGTARTERSLSQPFEGDQLLDFYARLRKNGVTLKLFPEQSTPLANEHSGHDKLGPKATDQDDCKSIFMYLRSNERLFDSLKNPPSTFAKNDIREEGYKRKDDLNIHLNKARRFKYNDPDDCLTKWIYENIDEIASRLSEESKDAFRLVDKCKSGQRAGQFKNIAMPQIYTILATMMNQDGELKLRDNNQIVGWEFVRRHLIPMSAFHRRGGVGRSNIFHHGAKHYIARKMDNKVINNNNKKVLKKRKDFSSEEKREFIFYRNLYCKCIRELFQVSKRLLSESTNLKSPNHLV